MPHGLDPLNRRPCKRTGVDDQHGQSCPKPSARISSASAASSTISRRTKRYEPELPLLGLRLGRQSRCQLGDDGIQAHSAMICFARKRASTSSDRSSVTGISPS